MITSSQIIELCEEFKFTVDSYKNYADVYENPSSSDFKEIYKESNYHILRFIFDNTKKKVYVWDAERAIHQDVAKKLGVISEYNSYNPNYIAGEASLSGGKATMAGSHSLESGLDLIKRNIKTYLETLFLQEVLKINWSWADRYVDCSRYMANLRTELDKLTKK